jgi:malonyl-CoA O-methyltransferase
MPTSGIRSGVGSWLGRLLGRVPTTRTLRPAEAYSLWAESYPPEAHNSFMAIEQAAVLEVLPALAGRRVLDVACGSGRYAQLALQRGAHQVVGTDSSRAMLARGAGFARLRADLTALPLRSASFDLVICGLALGHLPPQRMPQAIAEMARVVDRGGTVVFSDFHPYLYLTGHRRTLTLPSGDTYNVEHHPHLVADYFKAIRAAGLTVTALLEAKAEVTGRQVPSVLVVAAEPA